MIDTVYHRHDYLLIIIHNRVGILLPSVQIYDIHGLDILEMGSLVYRYWNDIPKHYTNVVLDAFVVMPDHIHGVIQITNGNDMRNHRGGIDTYRRDVACNVSTSERKTKNIFSAISPKQQSLPVIIRSYKSAVTRYVHINGNQNFGWQPRYYDRIIRSRRELHNVRRYIIKNPNG